MDVKFRQGNIVTAQQMGHPKALHEGVVGSAHAPAFILAPGEAVFILGGRRSIKDYFAERPDHIFFQAPPGAPVGISATVSAIRAPRYAIGRGELIKDIFKYIPSTALTVKSVIDQPETEPEMPTSRRIKRALVTSPAHIQRSYANSKKYTLIQVTTSALPGATASLQFAYPVTFANMLQLVNAVI